MYSLHSEYFKHVELSSQRLASVFNCTRSTVAFWWSSGMTPQWMFFLCGIAGKILRELPEMSGRIVSLACIESMSEDRPRVSEVDLWYSTETRLPLVDSKLLCWNLLKKLGVDGVENSLRTPAVTVWCFKRSEGWYQPGLQGGGGLQATPKCGRPCDDRPRLGMCPTCHWLWHDQRHYLPEPHRRYETHGSGLTQMRVWSYSHSDLEYLNICEHLSVYESETSPPPMFAV